MLLQVLIVEEPSSEPKETKPANLVMLKTAASSLRDSIVQVSIDIFISININIFININIVKSARVQSDHDTAKVIMVDVTPRVSFH